jgi:ADP-dependent NAD(P)H-hydrate dehydratase / NAD(P)H-hydrate epimerase
VSADQAASWRAFTPPAGVQRIDEELAAGLVPARDPRGHKGSFGTLVAVCGSLDYLGAALLVAMAAQRAGAGLVCLAVPASLQPLVAGRVAEAISLGLPEVSPGEVDAELAAAAVAARGGSAILAGCGMRAGTATRDLVLRLISATGPPAILDAEALNSLAAAPEWWQAVARPIVLTPHPGEFGRLEGKAVGDGDKERADRARAAAARWSAVTVLKGAHTVVAAPDGRAAMAWFENAALATAGTGDVLAGTIGSLLAQGLAPFEAACLGVCLHGLAGQNVRERTGDAGLVASDLPAELPRIRRHLSLLRDRAGGAANARVGFTPRADRG